MEANESEWVAVSYLAQLLGLIRWSHSQVREACSVCSDHSGYSSDQNKWVVSIAASLQWTSFLQGNLDNTNEHGEATPIVLEWHLILIDCKGRYNYREIDWKYQID